MKFVFAMAIALLTLSGPVYAADDVVSIVAGTVKKVDSGAKTLVVKTDDGAEHTFHFTRRVSVHAAHDVARTSDDTLHGLEEGSRVAVHYTAVAGRETAREIDVIGDHGLKATEGTVTQIDRGARVLIVKTGKGSEETFHLTGDAAKESAKGVEKSTKIVVYYTEAAGRKVVHFFR